MANSASSNSADIDVIGSSRTTPDNDNMLRNTEDESDEEIQKQLRTERIRRRNRIILFLFLASVIIFGIIDSLTTKYISSALSSLYHWVDSYPLPGAFVLTFVVLVATLAFIPGALLTIGCGAVFGMSLGLGKGVAVGSVVVFVGASLGSVASFIMGRYLLRDCVGKWVERYSLFKAVDKAMKKKGFRIFFLLRLSPIIPFNALNYMAGMTAVTFRDYTLALIGLLPGTVLYVFVGASAGNIMHDDDSESINITKGARTASIVGGIVVGILGIVAVSYYAKKELNHIIVEQELERQEQEDLEQQEVLANCNDEGISSTELSDQQTI
mmetsp:Transcript_12122/g.26442  ORF Transcript_12122/g.26442 Transcript_12122/m.26442 type:complete len:326 (+) Transcript_12122:213-1190(+)|eukprot:CAMPEP_0172303112 /NCGR_PEP_ID=MMETSP1058-20130122/4688_1 /TAXON_ID=83371 /ORGANISM="Detonula confervacea, Strain CCMP 353" /LENGTH=325 /DNA_ID=CAMNT_0013013819 /DNA_START=125 /DNA_END=1102 /DNA_ORIENTATION=+